MLFNKNTNRKSLEGRNAACFINARRNLLLQLLWTWIQAVTRPLSQSGTFPVYMTGGFLQCKALMVG